MGCRGAGPQTKLAVDASHTIKGDGWSLDAQQHKTRGLAGQ